MQESEINLHSNMVRFIIFDLTQEHIFTADLHSNMVRFIIYKLICLGVLEMEFTFQYG